MFESSLSLIAPQEVQPNLQSEFSLKVHSERTKQA